MPSSMKAVVFDMGGVLVDWNPDYLYRKLIPDQQEREHFLQSVCTLAWNDHHDAGVSLAENAKPLLARYANDDRMCRLIKAYGERYEDMFNGPIAGTVKIVDRLVEKNIPVFGLTNCSSEVFRRMSPQFTFFKKFKDVIVSGDEKVTKPDPRIYQILVQRSGYRPDDLVFVDDREINLIPAREIGLHGIRFQSPEQLDSDLRLLHLL